MNRWVDVTIAVVLLVILGPLILSIVCAVLIVNGRPVFYGGERVGLHGDRFLVWKFRTMVANADTLGSSSTPDDDSRVTPLGKWLRRLKLDELPQLWNVIIGDMNLVGPRPQVAWAVDRYTNDEKILLTVRPGITDPASLRFANEGEILRGHPDPDAAYFELIHPEKMRLSINYVKHRSALGDIKILLATVFVAFGDRSLPVPASQKPVQ